MTGKHIKGIHDLGLSVDGLTNDNFAHDKMFNSKTGAYCTYTSISSESTYDADTVFYGDYVQFKFYGKNFINVDALVQRFQLTFNFTKNLEVAGFFVDTVNLVSPGRPFKKEGIWEVDEEYRVRTQKPR